MNGLHRTAHAAAQPCRRPSHSTRGFSLLELVTAMAMFLVVAGAAFSLFTQHQLLSGRQQNLSGVNINMRNAMAQLEMDLSGAGPNYLAGIPTQGGAPPYSFTLGVMIQDHPPGSPTACTPNTTTWAYPVPSACFDTLTVVNQKAPVAGATYPPVLTINDASDNLSSSTTINAVPANPADVLATDAAFFQQGDEVLVLLPNNTASPPTCGPNQSAFCMAVITLTANATVVGANIQLTHSLIQASGKPNSCPGASCTDPLGIVYNPNPDPNNTNGANYYNALKDTFAQGAYLIDLGTGSNDITYSVQINPTNSADAQLVRCTGASCTAANEQVVVDQIVGFKVGAALWDDRTSGTITDVGSYFYDAALFCNGFINGGTDCDATSPPPANDAYDFTLVRTVRISAIGRTTPLADPSLNNFTNGFDNGHYLIQQAAVVVDLRNMSNGDFGN